MQLQSGRLTALMRAAAIGHLGRVNDLLREGKDVNLRGPRGSTALMFAAGSGHLEIVKALVEAGADVEAVEDGGWSSLDHARADKHFDIVYFLNSIIRQAM